ncbi:MAG TPA: ketol-acid reductoisomerase [Anaeromyxobacter sp.]
MREPQADRPVAVLGFGNQGEAHAHNLRDGGAAVVVGARSGGDADRRARAAGFDTRPLADAALAGRVISVLLPDEAVPEAWPAFAPAVAPGATVVFAHGFNLLYGALDLPGGADVVLVSPTGPGRVLRLSFTRDEKLPAYVAVHQDATGGARAAAERYAAGIGCAPLWSTSVREETEVDLFGEQVVLCGGMNALVAAAFETLVEAGYSEEIAYLECVHQLKYLADLLHERGPAGFRRAISGTALYGDLTRGPRVIGEPSRREMRAILEEIRSGAFAREWLAESRAGRPRLSEAAGRAERHPLESARRRALGAPRDPGVRAPKP